jgi:hypothetical protein
MEIFLISYIKIKLEAYNYCWHVARTTLLLRRIISSDRDPPPKVHAIYLYVGWVIWAQLNIYDTFRLVLQGIFLGFEYSHDYSKKIVVIYKLWLTILVIHLLNTSNCSEDQTHNLRRCVLLSYHYLKVTCGWVVDIFLF